MLGMVEGGRVLVRWEILRRELFRVVRLDVRIGVEGWLVEL